MEPVRKVLEHNEYCVQRGVLHMNIFRWFIVLILSHSCFQVSFAMEPKKLVPLSPALQNRAPLLLLFGAFATGCAGIYRLKNHTNLSNEELDALCLPSDNAPIFLDNNTPSVEVDTKDKP